MNLASSQIFLYLRGIACLASPLLALPSLAAESANTHWVHGSWVPVRNEASIQGQAIASLTANTPVTLLSRQAGWCAIESKLPAVRGFMACAFLGAKPLSLADVGTAKRDDGTPNPRSSPPRAFWLAPSMFRLLAAGEFFWSTTLSEPQKKKEDPFASGDYDQNHLEFDWDKRAKPLRFPIPEFEAMKDILKSGVIAAQEQRPRVARWRELQARARDATDRGAYVGGLWISETALPLIRAGRLNTVPPSLFKRAEELAPAHATVEQLSAQFGIKERMRVLRGPVWVQLLHESPRVHGSWDIGLFELKLEKPVIEYVIGRTGLASAAELAAVDKPEIGPGSCYFGIEQGRRRTRALPGFPAVKNPLAVIYTPSALPYKRVKIKSYAKRLEQKNHGASLLVMHDVDLDNDGVADLSVWEGMHAQEPYGDRVGARLIFANIAGEWHLISIVEHTECS